MKSHAGVRGSGVQGLLTSTQGSMRYNGTTCKPRGAGPNPEHPGVSIHPRSDDAHTSMEWIYAVNGRWRVTGPLPLCWDSGLGSTLHGPVRSYRMTSPGSLRGEGVTAG